MALKLLAFLAVFKLALTVSDPEPDSSVNIDIKQVVNGGAGCGGNGCCAEPELDCDYGDRVYRHGAKIESACMILQCINGVWSYTGKINHNCGECQVFGDPQLLTYDNHSSSTFYPPNWYSYNERIGNFVVSQSGLDERTKLSVTSMFESEPNEPTPYGYTAARSVCYFEPEITVCVQLPSFELFKCFDSSDHNAHHECAIKVTVNGYHYNIGKNIKVFNALAGNVLVFDHNHHGIIIDPYFNNGTDAMNTICINIVGSSGLSISLCTSSNNNNLGPGSDWSIYSHLYVWAMPHLKDQLYGMCDTYTGKNRDGYTMHNGTLTTDTHNFAPTWMINGSSINLPDLNKCLNATVLKEVEDQCASITKDICKVIPPYKCAGFIRSCEFDLCRVSNPDGYAQGYANHLLIESHLNQ